jgi:hypothetical protein
LPSSWARFGSFQTPESSSWRSTSARRVCFASKSKIPPQFRESPRQVGELAREGVDAFGFHGSSVARKPRVYRRLGR